MTRVPSWLPCLLSLLPVGTTVAQPAFDPVHLRAWQLVGQGRPQEAIPMLQGLVESGRGTAPVTLLLFEAFSASQSDDAGLAYFRQRAALNPADGLAHLGLAHHLAAAAGVAEAVSEASACAMIDPSIFDCLEVVSSAGRHFEGAAGAVEELRKLVPLDPTKAESQYVLCLFNIGWDRPDDAIRAGEAALRLAGERGDPALLAAIESALVSAFWKTPGPGDPKALTHATEACRHGRQLPDPEAEFLYCGGMAALLLLSKSDESEFQRLIRLAQELHNPGKQAQIEHGLSNNLAHLGRIEEALRHVERAVALRSSLPEAAGLSPLLRMQGVYQMRLGAYEAAISSFEAALNAGDAKRYPAKRAHVLASLTVAHNQAGNALEAIRTAEEAVRLFRQDGQNWQAGAELSDVGWAYLTLGDLPTAIRYFQDSLRSAHHFKDPGEIIRNGNLLAAAHLAMGQAELARADLLPALELFPKANEPRFQIRAYTLLGDAESQLGIYQSAQQHLASAFEAVSKVKDAWLEAEIWVALGRHRLRTGETGEAEKAFQAGLAIAEPAAMKQQTQAALSGLAEVEKRRNQPEQALQWLRRAVDALESLRSTAPGPELRAGLMERNWTLYRDLLQTAGSLHEKHPDAGYDKLALTYSERGRARVLLDLLEESRSGWKAGVTPEQAQRQRSLEQRLSMAITKMRGQYNAATRAAVERAEQDMRAWTTELRVQNPRFHSLQYPHPLDAEGIQRLAAERNVAIVEYTLGRQSSRVWVTSAAGLHSARLPGEAVIAAAVRRLRESLSKHPAGATADNYQTPARLLERMLIGPIRAHFGAAPATVIVADGILHYLPFEVLLGPDGRFLIERTALSYAPSASVFGELERSGAGKARRELLALGNPDFGAQSRLAGGGDGTVTRDVYRAAGLTLRPLPGTEAEARSIASLFATGETRLLLGRQASEAVFKSQPLGEFRRLHLATHALIDERAPARSGLVLSLVGTGKEDGVLQLSEIMGLPLDADLVTLSACQTGLGALVRGEGMVGFSRAFLFAGARRLAVSLWPVNDSVTPSLMRDFYRGMREGETPSRALRAVKLQMIRSNLPAYRHPHYWASFVLVGAR